MVWHRIDFKNCLPQTDGTVLIYSQSIIVEVSLSYSSSWLQVRLSDGTSPEPYPTISEADLDVSRHRIAVFLSAHKAYELLPESGKVWMILVCPNLVAIQLPFLFDWFTWTGFQVIALDVELPVKQAFHILHEQVPLILRVFYVSNKIEFSVHILCSCKFTNSLTPSIIYFRGSLWRPCGTFPRENSLEFLVQWILS